METGVVVESKKDRG